MEDNIPMAGGISAVVDDTTPQLGGSLDTNAFQVKWSKGADVASANALPILADGNYFDVTGVTAITSINTMGIGTLVCLHFDGILILTHHATDLILPSGANITTVAGDEAIFIEYAAGDWRCINYSRADGTALTSGLPDTIANVLTDHDTAAHDALDIDADTLDGSHAGNEANKIPILDIDAEIPTAQLPLPFLTLAEYQANTSTGTFSENPQFFNDGDTFYCCSSNAIDQYVEVDFGFPTWIKKFKHCGKSYNNGSGRFKIQGNFNGVWLDIKTDIPTETGWSSWIYLDRPMYTDKVRIVTTTVDSGIGKSVFCDSQLLG